MTENTLIAKGGSLLVLTAALLACFLPVFYFEYWVLHHTNGVFIYPVDDAFIHLQLSKNLAQHHNWGINVGEFNSASSSPFYTVLLSLLGLIFSSNILIPFLVNCVAAVALLVVVQSWLKKQGLGNLAQLVILLCIVFFLPLPVLVVSGMEHVLQCLFS